MNADIEASRPASTGEKNVSRLRLISYILALLSKCKPSWGADYRKRAGQGRIDIWGERERKLYRSGYPLYSSFLARHSEYQNFRRFRTLRMRMLLLKQDQITKLEEELNQIDKDEQSELFLGCIRRDKNAKRADVLQRLDEAFSQYDDLLQRSQWAINMPEPVPRHVRGLQGWVQAEGCIARSEIKYLDAEPYDLCNIGLVKDQVMSKVASVIQRAIVSVYVLKAKLFAKVSKSQRTHVVLSKPAVRATARVMIAVLAIVLLLVPVIALNAVGQTLERFIILFAASSCFVMAIALASEASMAEIFAAGAAYSAVLVVFISGNGVQAPSPG